MKKLLIGVLVGFSSLVTLTSFADTWTHGSVANTSALKNTQVQNHLLDTSRSDKHSTRSNINQNLNSNQKDHLKAQENVRLHSIYNSNH